MLGVGATLKSLKIKRPPEIPHDKPVSRFHAPVLERLTLTTSFGVELWAAFDGAPVQHIVLTIQALRAWDSYAIGKEARRLAEHHRATLKRLENRVRFPNGFSGSLLHKTFREEHGLGALCEKLGVELDMS